MGSIKVLLYTSKKLTNGEHPIMLRFIKDRKSHYMSIGKSCAIQFWDEANSLPKKSHPLYRELIIHIGNKRIQAEKFLLDKENHDVLATNEDLRSEIQKKKKTLTVFTSFTQFISRMNESGQIKNALIYKDALRQLKKFTVNRDLSFSQIDTAFLHRYEEFMRKCKLGPSTIFLYLRTLRALINRAIDEKYCSKDHYAFKDFSLAKYSKIKTRKRAIDKEDILAIANLEITSDSPLFHSRNYFMFSYYNRGINFMDMALLKWTNIISDRLNYTRRKTGENFTIGMLDPAKQILEHYKNNPLSDFIFPILNNTHDSPAKIQNRIHKMLKVVNKDLKEIGALAGVKEPLTTYVARHSFATVMKKSGISTSMISEAMGHDSERTTQIYLDSFENAVLDEAMRALI